MSAFAAISGSFGLGAANDVVSPPQRNGRTPESKKRSVSAGRPSKKSLTEQLKKRTAAAKEKATKKAAKKRKKPDPDPEPEAEAEAETEAEPKLDADETADMAEAVAAMRAKIAAKQGKSPASAAPPPAKRAKKAQSKKVESAVVVPSRRRQQSANFRAPSLRVSKYRAKMLATRASVPRMSEDGKLLVQQLHQALVGMVTRKAAYVQMNMALKSRTLSKDAVLYACSCAPIGSQTKLYGF